MDPDLIRIQRIFREVLEDESLQLRPDHSQLNLPGWDSLAQVKIIISLGEEFGIKFLIDEVAETTSVSGLMQLVQSKKGR